MEYFEWKVSPLSTLRHYINGRFCKREPVLLIAVTASTVLAAVWFWEIIFQPECLSTRMKRSIFKLVRKIPAISRKVEAEKMKLQKQFAKLADERSATIPYVQALPLKGYTRQHILHQVNKYLDQGTYEWKKGFVSGTVYNYNNELIDLLTQVYSLSSYTNPLHSDVFPGVVKMEAEVVRMTAGLFHGGPCVCGTMTSGGTESILMACKTYRDYGKDRKGIKRPEMILPRTAHPAFEKAATYFGITIRSVQVDPITLSVPVNAVKKAISSNTIMIVGSAPNYPYGTMDDIQGLAAVAKLHGVPMHVDCCLGGFLAPFMNEAGFPFPPFDFSVPGVTSISADTHKYGFAPKGSSVILYSDADYRQYQYCVTTDWPGGVYGSPSVNGSRAGGIIAGCWATLMYYGLEGYIESTKKIVSTTFYIERALREIEGIYIFGKPVTSVIAIGSNKFHIFRLAETLGTRGWSLNPLQFPSGIHICITYMHTLEGVADRFILDVRECVSILLEGPDEPVEGAMAVYGMSQGIPDRSLVGEFTQIFIDSMYLTPDRAESITDKHSNGGHSL